MSLEEHFWSLVWRCTHRHPCQRCCWPWLPAFAKSRFYGRASLHGLYQLPGTRGGMPVHRLAYIFTHGAGLLPFGKAIHICHTCDFSPCCNPRHLFIGTSRDNRHDRKRKEEDLTDRIITLPDGMRIAYPYRILRNYLRDEDCHMLQANRVRLLRHRNHMSQEDLGRWMGQDQQYISKLERGQLQGITVLTLERLCLFLHCSADYLLGLSDEPRYSRRTTDARAATQPLHTKEPYGQQ